MSAPVRVGVPPHRGNLAVARSAVPVTHRPVRPVRPVRPGQPVRPVRRPLRVVQSRPVGAPRTPFVLLVLTLLGAGLVALLLLNAAAVANADHQRQLRGDTATLELREQQLQRAVGAMEAPGALAEKARGLGMVPSGDPAFLVLLPDGTSKIVGHPQPAQPAPTGTADPAGSSSSDTDQAGAPEGGR